MSAHYVDEAVADDRARFPCVGPTLKLRAVVHGDLLRKVGVVVRVGRRDHQQVIRIDARCEVAA